MDSKWYCRSEECRVAGEYFIPIFIPFSCFNSKNACFGGFSFDSYSANDKKQLKIILFFRCCTMYMYDSFFNRYATPWIKISRVMLLTGWLPPFFRTFCDRHSNFCLLDLSASEHCGCYSSFEELLSYEKPSKHVFLELEHKKTLKIVKNVLRQHQIVLICLLVPIIAILNLVTLSL
jgi:hypothetical protein